MNARQNANRTLPVIIPSLTLAACVAAALPALNAAGSGAPPPPTTPVVEGRMLAQGGGVNGAVLNQVDAMLDAEIAAGGGGGANLAVLTKVDQFVDGLISEGTDTDDTGGSGGSGGSGGGGGVPLPEPATWVTLGALLALAGVAVTVEQRKRHAF